METAENNTNGHEPQPKKAKIEAPNTTSKSDVDTIKLGNTDRKVLEMEDKKLVAQGAEAFLYESVYNGRKVAVKVRPKKRYRVAQLDISLRRQRTRAELKALEKAKGAGIPCPALHYSDKSSTSIIMEWIEGPTLKEVINHITTSFSELKPIDNVIPACDNSDDESDQLVDLSYASTDFMFKLLKPIATDLGRLTAHLHDAQLVHRDITTSNIIAAGISKSELKATLLKTESDVHDLLSKLKLTFIDFGLAAVTQKAEDRAVDLYVLERAWISTHPTTACALAAIWEAYFETVEKSEEIATKLSEVRLRGRKRSMLG